MASREERIAQHRREWNEKQEAKKERAKEIRAAAAKRSPREQLIRLDQRRGQRKGAKRERARLHERLLDGSES